MPVFARYLQIFQVSSTEGDVRHDLNLPIPDLRYGDGISKVANTVFNLDLVVQKFFKRGQVEDLVTDRLGAVDGVLEP